MSPSTSTASAEVLVEDPGVEAGVLLGGERVELTADRVERDRDVERRPLAGALEEQVLEEVRAAVQGRRLVAGADADPDPDAGRADAGQLLGDDPQARRAGRYAGRVRSRVRRRPSPSAASGSSRRAAASTSGQRSGLGRRRLCSLGLGGRGVVARVAAPSASSTTGTSDSLPRSSISAICDLDLLAHRDDVLDGLDALAAGQRTELADVQQAVLARAAARRRRRSWSS